jgi:hypothetical protein
MARYIALEEWPGSVIYAATHGRVYCAAPRGLIPEQPYSMDALRPPNAQERRQWGTGVQPRMVLDVTEMTDLPQRLQRRTLAIAPWNAYLVLRLDDDSIVVAYRIGQDIPRLDRYEASQVALASGHDVEGWAAQILQHFGNERWHFTPPARAARNSMGWNRRQDDWTEH